MTEICVVPVKTGIQLNWRAESAHCRIGSPPPDYDIRGQAPDYDIRGQAPDNRVRLSGGVFYWVPAPDYDIRGQAFAGMTVL